MMAVLLLAYTIVTLAAKNELQGLLVLQDQSQPTGIHLAFSEPGAISVMWSTRRLVSLTATTEPATTGVVLHAGRSTGWCVCNHRGRSTGVVLHAGRSTGWWVADLFIF